MASLLDGIREALVEVLKPGTQQEAGELSALRQIYDPLNAGGGLLPNRWYRLHNTNGNCTGFSFVCNCGQEWRLLSAFEWAREYACPQCHAKFDLYKFVGVTDAEGKFKVGPREVEAQLTKLPVRPGVTGRPNKNVMDTWDDGSEPTAWEGKAPLGSDGSWI